MEILMLQTDIAWERPAQNRDHLLRMIYDAPRADIIVLPEMFTTGFTMSPETIAEKDGLPTLEWMLAVARERSAAVAGSIAVEENGKYYNRFYFVKPDGTYARYDKRHLFTFGGEHEPYTPGTERVVTEYKGFRILLQICYDLRFPVFARNRGDYDMIIYVASWAVPRIEVWNTLLRARAIENVCYVVGVNRVGDDPCASYNGQSALVDFKGRVVAAASGSSSASGLSSGSSSASSPESAADLTRRSGPSIVVSNSVSHTSDTNSAPHSTETGTEQTIVGFADLERLKTFRLKFPALRDADHFTLG